MACEAECIYDQMNLTLLIIQEVHNVELVCMFFSQNYKLCTFEGFIDKL